MSKHMDLFYDKCGVERKISIDNTGNGIFLSISKTVKGLENECEDVLLTKEDCEFLGNLLINIK